MYGKDPSKGIIIPLYEPPDKFSPASMGFIMNMGYDNKVFTAVVINIAVKGYLKIHEANADFTLIKTGAGESALSREVQVVATRLFTSSADQIKIGVTSRVGLNGARIELQRSLQNSLEKIYFFTNKKYFIVGLCISFLIMIASTPWLEEEEYF